MIEGFLLGVIAAMSFTSGVFFFRFWRDTKEELFLAFGTAFVLEGFNRIAVLFTERPNEGSPWIYLIRFLSFCLIAAAILRKNYTRGKP